MTGPLKGLRIIELAGLGPAPFAAMMFADHGAEVVRIERDGMLRLPDDPIERGRTTLKLDLKREPARTALLALVENADALIDPYRPGRIEALGLGPEILQARNPRLVIGRITGWGQTGPMSQQAGHDINYLALSGLLAGMGARDHRPTPPANLVADYGGGAMMVCFGMLAALLEIKAGAGKGRIVDAAMSEGSALLGSLLYGGRNKGLWRDQRESNLLDGGSPFYATYRCSDGEYLAVGSVEPAYRNQLLQTLGLSDAPLFASDTPEAWEEQREAIEERLAAEPRAYWLEAFEGKDACVSPVLSMGDAPRHPQHEARSSFVHVRGGKVPAPVPRYGPDPMSIPLTKSDAAARELLAEVGLDAAQIAAALDEEAS